MFEVEDIKNIANSSSLFEQANSSPDLSETQLNSPIENDFAELPDAENGLHGIEIESTNDLNTPIEQPESTDAHGLSLEDKVLLKDDTGWSNNIIDSIKTPEEAAVYKEANLKEVNGNLERTDIDWDMKIPQDKIDRMRSLYGDEVADRWSDKTNSDLAKEGKAPYGPDGERINLHHIGQKPDSPLAELTNTEHKSNDGILHDKTKTSEIERPVFRQEREEYWKNRYENLNNN